MKLSLFAFILCLFQCTDAKADTVDNYQIYIKKILVRNESGFPKHIKNKSFIPLNKMLCNEYLELHFHHCTGNKGKQKIKIVDKNGTVFKEFEFAISGYDEAINIPISFLCESSQIKPGVTYSLIFYDHFIKEGRHLTDLKIEK